METRKTGLARRTVWGIALMVFGILLLIENMGIIGYPLSHIIFSWQILLILIGTIGLVNRGINPPSIILIAVGLFFLVPGVGGFFWPAILILIGISILFHSHNHHWHRRWRSGCYHRYHHRCGSDWYSDAETGQKIQNSSTD